MNWKNKKVLVVGKDGFLSSHLVETLLLEGAHVRFFTSSDAHGNLDMGDDASKPPNLEIIDGSTSASLPDGGIYDAVKGCEVVYHLGILDLNLRDQKRGNHNLQRVNADFMNSLNLFLACREVGISRVVQVSRKSELEEIAGNGINNDEYLEIDIMNHYIARYSVDDLARNFFDVYGLPVVMVHIMNLFGPRQPVREVIPSMIGQLLDGRDAIDAKVPGLIHEFTYITDAVHGLLLAGSMPGMEGRACELGTGHEIHLSDLAGKIALKLGNPRRIAIKKSPARRQVANENSSGMKIYSARELLRWEPQVTLDEGLDRAIDWMRRLHMQES